MFNVQFIQTLATKSTDFVWVAFLVFANDIEKTNPTLAFVCVCASVLIVLANVALKAFISTRTSTSINNNDAR